jgi:catechol 2,3-dioxygenase-like lactoylglutathione lyase family enzyme
MESDLALKGIHHITLIARNAERTVRLYVETLGHRAAIEPALTPLHLSHAAAV